MKSVCFKVSTFRLLSSAALASVLLTPVGSLSQDQSSASAQTSPDNSAVNQNQSKTADQQSNATSDRMLTKKVRQALIADKSLSTYGHNVKIITKDGSVTLKGPVQSEEEKQSIASKAESIVGSPDKVTNQLTIKQ
jgi:hyperosmotically inducible periplasmic protein